MRTVAAVSPARTAVHTTPPAATEARAQLAQLLRRAAPAALVEPLLDHLDAAYGTAEFELVALRSGRREVVAEYLAAIADFRVGAGYELPAEFVVASGRKAG